MSDTPEEAATTSPASADELLQVGQEIRKKRGRPPGSKNKTSGESKPVNETNQRRIFAGALIAMFSLLAIVLGWFGYEYHKKLEMDEAERGGTYLIPIASKIGFIATLAFYLSFPIWLLTQVNESFRKKKPETAVNRDPPRNGAVSPGTQGSSSVDVSAGEAGEPNVDVSPISEPPGFSPLPLDN
jgi:hypothetical protein